MDFELVSLVLAVLSWNKRSKGVTPPRWWLVTVVTLSVNRGPESSWIVLYCGIPIRVRSVVVVRLLCWEYTLIKLRLLVLVISTNGYNSYSNIGDVMAENITLSMFFCVFSAFLLISIFILRGCGAAFIVNKWCGCVKRMATQRSRDVVLM